MAILTLHRKPLLGRLALPLWVFINGQPVGMMRSESVSIQMPEGTFKLSVKLIFQIWRWRFEIGGEDMITTSEATPTSIEITDRERLWNILFDLDLVIWLASLFFTLPHAWNIVYHVLSDGFFVVWIIRIMLIRKRYFHLEKRSSDPHANDIEFTTIR